MKYHQVNVFLQKNSEITFQKRTELTYLAPSLHSEFRISILKFNVKRAPDMSSLFYFEMLKLIYLKSLDG